MSKRAIDHEAGVTTWFHIREIDIPSAALRSLFMPRRESAWRTELMVPRRAYRAEFTTCRRLAAMTVSFSIRSPSLLNETSSPASDAIRRFRIGENGGSALND